MFKNKKENFMKLLKMAKTIVSKLVVLFQKEKHEKKILTNFDSEVKSPKNDTYFADSMMEESADSERKWKIKGN